MKKVAIHVLRKVAHTDLSALYENPIEHACDMTEGTVYLSVDNQKPAGLCQSAWESMQPFVMTLAHGGGDFYQGWMKNPYSAMISCNDGFRPVSFYLEVVEEESLTTPR